MYFQFPYSNQSDIDAKKKMARYRYVANWFPLVREANVIAFDSKNSNMHLHINMAMNENSNAKSAVVIVWHLLAIIETAFFRRMHRPSLFQCVLNQIQISRHFVRCQYGWIQRQFGRIALMVQMISTHMMARLQKHFDSNISLFSRWCTSKYYFCIWFVFIWNVEKAKKKKWEKCRMRMRTKLVFKDTYRKNKNRVHGNV